MNLENSKDPWPLKGRTYIVKLNGKRSLNGKLAGYTSWGDIESCPPETTVWDVLRAIIDESEAEHLKVEHVQQISLILHS